jgi:hypothetical protein
MASIDGSAEREAREHNQAEIAEASYRMQREALQRNLNLTYGSFLVSILALIVATAAVVIALTRTPATAQAVWSQVQYAHRR